MLLTISTTHVPASDLGYLLHKHPDKVQRFELSYGAAHVYYPQVSESLCSAALLLDIDPIRLVRSFQGGSSMRLLSHYVNDRPYVASSFLSVAIGQVYRSALAGRCEERQSLAETPIPLQAHLAVVPVRGGEALLRELFEPLGYTLEAQQHGLDPAFPGWGDSHYFSVTLNHRCRLSELLSHLYVLLPVLDREKHYWVGDAEVEKLLHHGEGWLAEHPAREIIARRYLKFRPGLARQALTRLAEGEDAVAEQETQDSREEALEKPLSLHEQRLRTVHQLIRDLGAKSVVDLGCGEGRLLRRLLDDARLERILGMDVSARSLELATERLRLERRPERQRQRLQLIQGSLSYRDPRLAGFDVATLIEVVEHLEPDRLPSLVKVVFGHARPARVILTTPNREYNARFENLPQGQFRHPDHRFEWTRAEFRDWAEEVAEAHGYTVRFQDLGEEDASLGAPSQLGLFEREDS